jgi:hypothetical protein
MPDTNIEPELMSLRTKLAVEIEKDRKEIESLKKRMNKNEALLEAVKGALSVRHPVSSEAGYGSKRETIREAINRIPKLRFIQDEVEDQIRQINPAMEINRNRIRAALWNMTERGKLKLFRKGTNKTPAEYEKVNEETPPSSKKPSAPVLQPNEFFAQTT